VLEEAANPDNPLLERIKFLAIFESNLDEFYMVRVSGLIEQYESGLLELSPDGLTPDEQLKLIAEIAGPLRRRANTVYREQIAPGLADAGIRILTYAQLTEKQKRHLSSYFAKEVFPLCTPIILHPAPSVPFISSRSLNIAVELSDSPSDVRLARIKVPEGVPRAVRLRKSRHEYVLLEEIISQNLSAFFYGVTVKGAHLFRLIRDADVEIRELEAADLITIIEETIRLRRFGDPVLLEVASNMPDSVKKTLMEIHRLEEDDVMTVDGMMGMDFFWEISNIDKPHLKFPPHVPYLADALASSKALFDAVSQQDVLVHLPYDSFRPVEEFVGSAYKDPDVLGIKQTLYRVGSESPLVESLLTAAESGKQVATMVELKARFDESNNLEWARALERAGVHVTYGFPDMKTHCKLCLVVRREHGGLHMYTHIGTGNYNPATARLYTDLGLFTDDDAIVQDVLELFNYLTGFSKQTHYRKLLVAPVNLREGILNRIKREIAHHKKDGKGRIIWKLNALVDPEVVEALYVASQAGVKVDLIVRGVCCIRPGVKGLSENIRSCSIVGRFLEHSRIYYFRNGGTPDVLIGSADAMRRNLDRRIEVLVPVEDPRLIEYIHDRILEISMKDTVRAWELLSDGTYARRKCSEGKPFDSQNWFMSHPATRELFPAAPAHFGT
jgi:polyphosphate kinase